MGYSGNSIFIVLVEADQKFYALSDEKGNIAAYDTEKVALTLIEKSYNSRHRRGYEESMSAAMNWLLFHPKVVPVTGTEDCWEDSSFPPSLDCSPGLRCWPHDRAALRQGRESNLGCGRCAAADQ